MYKYNYDEMYYYFIPQPILTYFKGFSGINWGAAPLHCGFTT